MFRFTINRALVFAATCSVAAHGSFVLISGDLARQSTTPRIDRDGGTQASELVQIAGILSAEITETTQPEHLKPLISSLTQCYNVLELTLNLLQLIQQHLD